MNDDLNPRERRIEAGLRILLEQCTSTESGSFNPPDESTVMAFVEGRADEAQAMAVEEAMLRSPKFMEMIGDLVQVERDFEDGHMLEQAADVEVPDGFLRTEAEIPTASILERLRDWFGSPITGLGTLAVVAVAVAIILASGSDPERDGIPGLMQTALVAPTRIDDRAAGDVPTPVVVAADTDSLVFVVTFGLPDDILELARVRVEIWDDEKHELVQRSDPHMRFVDGEEGEVYAEAAVARRELTEGLHSIVIEIYRVGGGDDLVETVKAQVAILAGGP